VSGSIGLEAAPPTKPGAPDAIAPAVQRARDDDWPRTGRLMPWLLAAFMALLFLVPFDAIDLDVSLPFDSKLDRIALVAIALVWCATTAVGVGAHTTRRPLLVHYALGLFVAVAVASVLLNLAVLVNLGEDELAVKKLSLLVSYVAFFGLVATTLRPGELRNFGVLLVGLACLTAIGTIYEYRTGTNVFYDWARDVFAPVAEVGFPPEDPKYGRPSTVGPGRTPLTVTTMMALVLPFAVVGIMTARSLWARLSYAVAAAVVLTGALATLRKTGVLAPAAALLVLLAYRPAQMIRLVPLALILALCIQAMAPGAAVKIKAQFAQGNLFQRNTTHGRTSDYAAVKPDLLTYPVLGRGYGTYDADRYRILDNAWLGMLLEVGAVGLLAFAAIFLAALVTTHPVIRGRDTARAPPALAAAAACAAFACAAALFDVLSFPQAPYLLFFALGVAVVAGSSRLAAATPARPSEVRHPAARPRAEPPSLEPLDLLEQPDLSVVMVAHNNRAMALTTLHSARAAVGNIDAEWLVVDCGSTDGVADAIAWAFDDVVLFRGPNIGFAAGANAALPHARGRYVLLLNPDVEITEGTLEDLVRAMDRRPGVGAASIRQFGPDGALLPSIRRFPSVSRRFGEALFAPRWTGHPGAGELELRPEAYTAEQSVDWVVGAFLMLRGKTLREVGPLDERFFLYSEEADWCYRCRSRGWSVHHLPDMAVTHFGADRGSPELVAQLSHSKALFAKKHFGRGRAAGMRLAIATGHALRIAMLAPVALVRPRVRQRIRREVAGLKVVLWLAPPPFDGGRRKGRS
jgi:GT2 family glycosyltransferase